MSVATTPPLTPMMSQWQACKERAGEALVLFRLGDFYEAFHEDAKLIAKELHLTLTKRSEVPMCGVPVQSLEATIDKLIARGHKVAIAEQLEDPKECKGIVKRQIVRTITPGTLIHSSLLEEKSNNFVAALTQVGSIYGLALLDLTTADFRVLECEDPTQVIDELSRQTPSELIVSAHLKKGGHPLLTTLKELLACALTERPPWHFDHETCLHTLLMHFGVSTLDGFGLRGLVAAINAAGSLLSYVSDELQLSVQHIERMHKESVQEGMVIDRAALTHLELTASLSGNKESTLLKHLDHTSTAMGARKLKQWILRPLIDPEKIGARQDAIASLFPHLSAFTSALSPIQDMERLIMRLSAGYGSPRDCHALRLSLQALPAIKEALTTLSAPLLQALSHELIDLSDLAAIIEKALVEEPPMRLSDGGIFKAGYHEELDELRDLVLGSQEWIASYQSKLREETGIKTLKVGFTKAFGYYIEVSRTQSGKMPPTFHRRQTLVGAERFISDELKTYEERALSASEKIARLEHALFQELREKIAAKTQEILLIASRIATLDCLLSLAHVAHMHAYTCPQVDESNCIEICKGRHPVIERSLKTGSFIPNDTLIDEKENRLLLITGPNMAGKSTYMRQVALIVILAQIGSFVPAERAHIGIVDKVFTRIGASDDLARGQSTFMVEMAETASILHNATARSLVILDEIGRGTSTFDGISIAWAVAEYLLTHTSRRAKTLFATHYFELTELEAMIPGAVNYNVLVQESDEGIVFLHTIARGSADKSYGIHVAKLAGLPPAVIKRAEARLKRLEKLPSTPSKAAVTEHTHPQLSLFDA